RPKQRCPRGPESSQTLVYLADSRFALPLLHQRPALDDRSPRQPQRKSLFGRDRNCLFCLFLSDCPLLAKMMKPVSKAQSIGAAMRVGSAARQHPRLIAPAPRLLSIAQEPEVKSPSDETGRPRVLRVLEGQGAVVLHVIQGSNLLEMRSG